MKRFPLWFLVLPIVLLPGCISYTTLQTPETLPPGKVSIGAGAAIGDGVMAEVGGRVGVLNRADVGLKIALPGLIFADTKVRLTDGPLFVAADLGFSHMKLDDRSDGVDSRTYGLYPMVLVGGKRWYVGGKGIYLWTDGEAEFFGRMTFRGSGWLGPAAVAGLRLGSESVTILLEANAFFPRETSPFFVGGVGLQFVL